MEGCKKDGMADGRVVEEGDKAGGRIKEWKYF